MLKISSYLIYIITFLGAKKKMFSLFVDRDFYEIATEQSNAHAENLQRNSGTNDIN